MKGEFKMSKKVALITGASTGIGADSAVRLAKDGFDLAISSRSEAKLEPVAEQCRAEGAEVLVVTGDMSKEEDVKNVFQKTVEKYGKIDFYFCNQGVLMTPKVFEDQTLDDYYLVTENNFKSVFLCLIECINIMKNQDYGNILVTGSSSGIRPEAGFGVYSASKHAVVGLVKDAAIECSQFNIRINCVCPGGILTPMTMKAGADIEKDYSVLRRSNPPMLPGREMGKPSDISSLVSFIASDQCDYICGSVISVDNGITQ